MVVKEVKKYPRAKGGGFNYSINIAKKDNLEGKVKILRCKDYIELTNKLNNLEKKINEEDKQKIKNLQNEESEKRIEIVGTLNKTIEEKNKKIASIENTIKELQNENNELNLKEKDNRRLIKENTELYSKNNTIEKRLTSKYQNIIDDFKKQIQDQENEKDKLSMKLESIENTYEDILQILKDSHKESQEELNQRYDKLNKEKERCIELNSSMITNLKNMLQFNLIDLLMNKYKKTIRESIKKEFTEDKIYELAPKKE